MTLSPQKEEEMYETTLLTARDIRWIRKQIQDCDETAKEQADKIANLEVEHSLLKGKLGAFILGLSFIVSLLVNGILWAFSRFGAK
jgi:hypothetical protein